MHRSLQMHARLQPLCISRVCGASFPVTAAMFVDAALPHTREQLPGVGATG
jgi:hypothetical protein